MARRSRDSFFNELFEFLTEVPIWVGPVMAAVVGAISAWVLPALAGQPPKSGEFKITYLLFPLLGKLGVVLAGAILVMWVFAEVRKIPRRLRARHLAATPISHLTWAEFESRLGQMFRKDGYQVVETGSTGGDGGVDLRLSRAGERALVQCKHWKSWSVGVSDVREFFGVMSSERVTKGFFVTSGSFTKATRDFARDNPMIVLLDGSALAARFPKDAATVQRPAESGSAAPKPDGVPSPQCPNCGASMVLRTSRQGQHAGSQFWGCPRYPQCRGLRQIANSAKVPS